MHLRTHIGSGSRQLQLLWQDASLDALEDLHAFEQMQPCIVSRMPATQDHPGFFLHFFRSDKCFATNQVHSCTKLTSVGFFTMCAKFPITQSPDIVWPLRKKYLIQHSSEFVISHQNLQIYQLFINGSCFFKLDLLGMTMKLWLWNLRCRIEKSSADISYICKMYL